MRKITAAILVLAALGGCKQKETSIMSGVEQEMATKMDPGKNETEGKAFLAAKEKEDGVMKTASGLMYHVDKAGDPTGPHPTIDSVVRVHYEGSLIDGSVFDSSIQRGEPAEFPVGRLVQAWQEALPLMRPGDEWTLYVPSELGYGAGGSPPDIPPNAVLVFKMQLLGIVSGPTGSSGSTVQ